MKEWVSVAVAGLGLLLFLLFYSYALWKTWRAPQPASPSVPPPDVNDPFNYVATTLAGLVGGVFAVFFGIEDAAAQLLPEQVRVFLLGAYLIENPR